MIFTVHFSLFMSDSTSILIIDDGVVNRNALQTLIEPLGHTTILAKNGHEGLTQMRANTVDLVLLDIVMPKMDGYEVLEAMKDNDVLRHIPVIMITAIDEIESVVRCIERGADDYLVKPFNSTLLKARISACLEKKHLYDQGKHYQNIIEKHNLDLEAQVLQKDPF